MSDRIASPSEDGIDRRGMLCCMAWVGTGLVWSMRGGVPSSRVLGQESAPARPATSRSSRSATATSAFSKAPNKDVAGTLHKAIAQDQRPAEQPRRSSCTRAT